MWVVTKQLHNNFYVGVWWLCRIMCYLYESRKISFDFLSKRLTWVLLSRFHLIFWSFLVFWTIWLILKMKFFLDLFPINFPHKCNEHKTRFMIDKYTKKAFLKEQILYIQCVLSSVLLVYSLHGNYIYTNHKHIIKTWAHTLAPFDNELNSRGHGY